MKLRLMVCKCALPSMRADAASKHEPAPPTRTEVRKEPRDLHLFLFLVLIHLLLFQKGKPGRLLSLPPPVKALQDACPLFVDQTSGRPLMTLGHWHIHELLRRHLMSAQRGSKVRTQFRPRVRTLPRTFFHPGKSAKNPLENRQAKPVTDIMLIDMAMVGIQWASPNQAGMPKPAQPVDRFQCYPTWTNACETWWRGGWWSTRNKETPETKRLWSATP